MWSWDSGTRGTTFPSTGRGEDRRAEDERYWGRRERVCLARPGYDGPDMRYGVSRGRSTVLEHLVACNSLNDRVGIAASFSELYNNQIS